MTPIAPDGTPLPYPDEDELLDEQPAPAGPPAGLPPEIPIPGEPAADPLAGLLGGEGAPAGPPATPGAPGIDDPRFREALQILEQVLQAEPDDQDSAALAKLVAELYKLVAARQAATDKTLGNSDLLRALRRSG